MRTTILSIALASTALASTAINAGAAELRMSWWGGDSRHIATQEALKVCGAKHGHTIKPEFTGWSGHFQKVATQIAGRTEADIMQINWPWLPIFSARGTGFADLETLAALDLDQFGAEQLDAGRVAGTLNGLPVSTTGRLFAFNKATWDRAGLPLPQTLDDLVAAGPVFRDTLGEGYYPFEAAALDAAMIVTLVGTQQTGKPLIDPATNRIAWTEAEMIEAITFYQRLVDNHVIPSWKDVAAAGNVPLHENPKWARGEIAGTYQWDSTYFKISDPLNDDANLVYVGLLGQDGQKTPGIYRKASMVFSISRNSDHPEAAAEVLNCLLNEPEGIAAMGSARGVPASRVAKDQLVADGTLKPVQLDAQALVVAADGPAIHPFMEHPDVRSALIDNLELFAYGEIDAATAAEEMFYGIEEALEDIDS